MDICSSRNLTVSCGNFRLLREGLTASKTEIFSLYFLVPLNIVSMLLAAVGNGLVCYVIATQKRFCNPSNIMLAGLASTDFLVGTVVQPLFLVHLIVSSRGTNSCVFYRILYYFSYACVGASLKALMLLTLERWAAILFPFKHEDRVTVKKCFVTVLIVWFVAVTEPLSPTLGLLSSKTQDVIVMVFCGLLTIVIITCYSMILTDVRRHRRSINTQENSRVSQQAQENEENTKPTLDLHNSSVGFQIKTPSDLKKQGGLIILEISGDADMIHNNHAQRKCVKCLPHGKCMQMSPQQSSKPCRIKTYMRQPLKF